MQRLVCVVLLLLMPVTQAESITEFTKGMQANTGFMTFYWDETKGKVFLEVKPEEEILYVNSLASGVGSNDIGLDRGQLGETRIIVFERVGPKLLLKQPNLDYRALSENLMERKAVEDAFASSILWGFEVVAESKNHVLIDATEFLFRDSHGIAERLKRTKQGSYKADESRSAMYLPRSKSFPDNTELEATITMVGSDAGQYLRSVTPNDKFITVRTHHSFIRLPDDNYQPRDFDPRVGAAPLAYKDYAVSLGQDMTQRKIYRHRIEPGKPIIYYLDPGTPEPIRSALLEGASWWAEAFDAIGLKDMYRVEMLPEDADPMDVRYNTIQWVHRSTRGWSYGYSIADPRTGEILKGHVTLGSLRVRQDMLIAQGLLSPFENGDEVVPEIEAMALARLRQLSAHEVGHTLGLRHNFAASAEGRASVMDYPHPLISMGKDGNIGLNDAYGVGMGEWDMLSMEYHYRQFSKEQEAEGLKQIIAKIEASGIPYISDPDSRINAMAHPTSSLWDNGSNVTEELRRILAIRESALSRFGETTIKTGQALSELEKYLVPIYFLHRYQAQATAKLIGGMDYQYAIRGSSLPSEQIMVAASEQRAALQAILDTMTSDALKLPQALHAKLLPPAYGHKRDRENFKHRTTPIVDALAMAETGAKASVSLLLNPQRVSRLLQQHAMDDKQLSLYELLSELLNNSWRKKSDNSYNQAIQQSINWAVLEGLSDLALSPAISAQARAEVLGSLNELSRWLQKKHRIPKTLQFAYDQAVADIDNLRSKAIEKGLPKSKPLPPGSPIGN